MRPCHSLEKCPLVLINRDQILWFVAPKSELLLSLEALNDGDIPMLSQPTTALRLRDLNLFSSGPWMQVLPCGLENHSLCPSLGLYLGEGSALRVGTSPESCTSRKRV